MFNPSREQARRFLINAWRTYRQAGPLTSLEQMAVEVIAAHPEYQRYFDGDDRYLDRDWTPEAGETNPYLHVSLHLAVDEQLSIDQPRGIRAVHDALVERYGGDVHRARHDIAEALAETIWRAQRDRSPPDVEHYLALAKRHLTGAARGKG